MTSIASSFCPVAEFASAQLAQTLRRHGSAFTQFARRMNPEIPRLEKLLAEIESRLGTETEQQDDFERCRELAHRLASLFCVGALVEFTSSGFEHSTSAGVERWAS